MGILLGVHETTTTAPSVTARRFVRNGADRTFVSGVIKPQDLVKRFTATNKSRLDAGLSVVWSFKPSPAEVRNGKWRPHIEALAKHLKNNGLTSRVVIVIWHEPENDVPKYFKNATEFVALFNIVHDWLLAIDPLIVTCHAALAYRYADRIDIGDAEARQWVTKATINAIDIYSGRSFPLSMTLGSSTAFRRWKNSRPAGAKWAVSERGWIADKTKSQARAESILAELTYLTMLPKSDQPVFYLVWNTPGTESDPLIVLDAAGERAVNQLIEGLRQLPPVPEVAKPGKLTPCPTCSGTGWLAG